MNWEGIKPAIKGESDKYSWNLYNFLNKQTRQRDIGKYVKKQLKVYWLTSSWWDGSYLEFNPDKLILRQVLICPLGNGSFYNLSTIMRENKAKEWAMIYRDEALIDITDWFFNTYEQHGRCIFDRGHNGWWQGSDNRYTYVNNTRKCNWCGKWQHKEIHKVVEISRKVTWK